MLISRKPVISLIVPADLYGRYDVLKWGRGGAKLIMNVENRDPANIWKFEV